MSKDNGGPAFPVSDYDHQVFQPRTLEDTLRDLSGMTLRDYFAAKALQGFMANKERPQFFQPEDDAAYVYALADAMLKERLK